MDNVIDLGRMREQKIIDDTLEEIELEPVGGRPVLGTLTPDEKILYLNMIETEFELIDLGQEHIAGTMEDAAQIMRDGADTNEFVEEMMQRGENPFKDEATAAEYHELAARHLYLKHAFWWAVRSRLQTFATFLTICAGYRVCNSGNKYGE